jgi:hypothetical protein
MAQKGSPIRRKITKPRGGVNDEYLQGGDVLQSGIVANILLTGRQIKAARALIGISMSELAKASDLDLSTIRRIEGASGFPNMKVLNLRKIQHVLEKAGVEFAADGGVRLRS